MSDFVFPESEKMRHRDLGWKKASIPSAQEIDGSSATVHALFFCTGVNHLARIFDYEWVVVDKGTYTLKWTPYGLDKKSHGHTHTNSQITLDEANDEIERVCSAGDISLYESYGQYATPQSMKGKDDIETLWIELYSESAYGALVHTGYLYFNLQKKKVQKKKEISDKDNTAGVDFSYSQSRR